MANTDSELEEEVRDFTDVGTNQVSTEEFYTILNDAKRHIKIRRSFTDEQADWYGDPAQEEALNWTTKLFLKVAIGELDSNSVQAGAIDSDTLLAKADNEATVWFRNSEQAINSITITSTYGIRSSGRRTYDPDNELV